MNKHANILALALLSIVLASCSPYGKLESNVISTSVRRMGPGEYVVMGAVVKPGRYQLESAKRLRVSQAIQRAGGFAQFANKKHVILRRGSGEYMQRIYIDLDLRSSEKPRRIDRVFRSDDTPFDPYIRGGYVVIVEENFLTW